MSTSPSISLRNALAALVSSQCFISTSNAEAAAPVDCRALTAERTQIENQYDELVRQTKESFKQIKLHKSLGALSSPTRSGSTGESIGNSENALADAELEEQREILSLRAQESAALRDLANTPCQDNEKAWATCMNLDAGQVTFEGRISACTTFLQSGIDSPIFVAKALAHRADAYLQLGENQLAKRDCDRSIILDPNSSDPFVVRGLIYHREGDTESAIRDYDKALQIAPTLASVMFWRGQIYHGAGDLDRAIADYDQTIRLKPDYAEAYLARANAYSKKEDREPALADYDRANTFSPNANALNGACWSRAVLNKELDIALKNCNESLRLRPGDANTLGSRGVVYFRLSQYSQAIADLSESLAINPKSADCLYVRGLSKRRLHELKEATSDVAKAKTLDPKIDKTYARYGITP